MEDVSRTESPQDGDVTCDPADLSTPASPQEPADCSPAVSDVSSGELSEEEGGAEVEEAVGVRPRRDSVRHSVQEDQHGELDYEEEDEEQRPPQTTQAEVATQSGGSDGEALTSDGELQEDDDCEEGEITDDRPAHSTSPYNTQQRLVGLCKFFARGSCTWGNNCRFVHPGVNDRERTGQEESAPNWDEIRAPIEMESRSHPVPAPKPPTPPPASPPTESAWERGLRHAKELRKKAQRRKETEENFEEKKMTLTITKTDSADERDDRGDRSDSEEKNGVSRLQSVVAPISPDPQYGKYEDDMYYYGGGNDPWSEDRRSWPREDPYYRGDREPVDKYYDRRPNYDNKHVESEDKYAHYAERFPPPVERYKANNEQQRGGRGYVRGRGRGRGDYNRGRGGRSDTMPSRDGYVDRKKGEAWADPWSRVKKSPKPQSRRSGSGSPHSSSRRRRSYSRGSSSSYSSYSSRSRSNSRSRSRSSSYSSRSSYSRSSYSSRSSSGSPSPHRRGGRLHSSRGQMSRGGARSRGPSDSGWSGGSRDLPSVKPSTLGAAVAQARGVASKTAPKKDPVASRSKPTTTRPTIPSLQPAQPPHRKVAEPVSRPEKPSARPSQPTARPSQPAPRTSQPTARTTQPAARPSQPTARPTQPSKPTQPTSKPTQPTTKPTQPAAKPTQPATRPKQPTSRPTQSADVGRDSRTTGTVKDFSAESSERGRAPVRAPPGRGVPHLRKKSGSISSSGSSRSRSRSYSSSRSRSRSRSRSSSRSSVSSRSSFTSTSSGGSADSEHLYRDLGASKKRRPSEKSEPPPRRARPSAPPPGPPPIGSASTGMPVPVVKEAPVKDALMMTGLKSSIKLTLKSDKPTAKKRPASSPLTESPVKRTNPEVKEPVRLNMPRKEPPARAAEPPPPAAPAQPKPKKKSTSSRREELLQQLKAVEDAIKRKRAKIT